MSTLTGADYRQAFELLAALARARSRTEYVDVLLLNLNRVIPCDDCSFEPIAETSSPRRLHEMLSGRAEHPRPSQRLHDRIRAREQLHTTLDGPRGAEAHIVLGRSSRKFSDRDRALLELLSPQLHSGYVAVSSLEGNAAAEFVDDAPSLHPLSTREREVLALVSEGHTNQLVGRTLGISARTVQKHLEHIFRKLRVETRTAAAARVGPRYTFGRPRASVLPLK